MADYFLIDSEFDREITQNNEQILPVQKPSEKITAPVKIIKIICTETKPTSLIEEYKKPETE